MDFTQEIKLTDKENKKYTLFRTGLFVLFVAGVFYMALVILFPTQYFTFDLSNPNSTKNTIVSLRNNQNIFFDNDQAQARNSLYFDAPLLGNYSVTEINFTLNKNSKLPNSGKVILRKSFQAFLCPESMNKDFLLRDTIEEMPYPNGTLVSNAGSVYITSKNKIFPIDNTLTFEAMGYHWEDVIPIDSNDLSFYKKQKLLTMSSAHPDGTILKDRNTENYFVINNGERISLTQAELSAIEIKTTPIAVSSSDANISENCTLEKSFWNKRKYSCQIPVEKFQNLIGKDYEFNTAFNTDVKIDSIDVKFKQNINWFNLKSTGSLILARIKNNYVGE